MTRVYKFELIIYPGNDEIWEGYSARIEPGDEARGYATMEDVEQLVRQIIDDDVYPLNYELIQREMKNE